MRVDGCFHRLLSPSMAVPSSRQVVLVRLELSNDAGASQLAYDDPQTPLGEAIAQFRRRCPELTDRSKKRKRECTNVC